MDFLSSNIFTRNVLSGTGENITLIGVPRNHTANIEGLADLIRQSLKEEDGLTLRKIEERSGGGITHSYLSKILSGAARNPSIEKLKAIAKGLRRTQQEVFAAAGNVPASYDDPLELRVLFDGWDEASDEAKAQAIEDVRMIAERFQRKRKSSKAPTKGKK